MIRNMYMQIGFEDICGDGKDAWFCNLYFGAIFHVDIETQEINMIAVIGENPFSEYRQYTAIGYYDRRLILAPNNSKYILIFSLETNNIIRKIDISFYVLTNIDQLFKEVIVRGDKAYLMPGRSRSIIVLDLTDYSVTMIDLTDWICDECITDNSRILVRHAHIDDQGNIIIPMFQTGIVLLITKELEIRTLEVSEQPLSSVFTNDNGFYFSLRDKTQLVWYQGNKSFYIDVSPEGFVSTSGFDEMVYYNHSLILIPRFGNGVVEYDLESKTSKILLSLPMKKMYDDIFIMNINAAGKKIGNRYLVISSFLDSQLIVYDLTSGNDIRISLRLCGRTAKYLNSLIYDNLISTGEIIKETNFYDLNAFIPCINNDVELDVDCIHI